MGNQTPDHDEDHAPTQLMQAPQSSVPSIQKPNNDIWKIMKKGISNAKARSVIGSKNTKESIKILQAKQKVLDRKKAFGVEFLELLEESADKSALEACVDGAMGDIGKLQEKINRWSARIDTNNEKLQLKLHKKKAELSEDANESDSDEQDEEEKDSDCSDDELVDGEPERFEAEYDNDSISQLSSNGTSVTGSITDQSHQSQRKVVRVTMELEDDEQQQEEKPEAPSEEAKVVEDLDAPEDELLELEAPEDELQAEAQQKKEDDEEQPPSDDTDDASSLQVLAPSAAPSFDEGSNSANHTYHGYSVEGSEGEIEIVGLSLDFPARASSSIAIAEEAMALASAETRARASDHPSDERLPTLSEHGLQVVEEGEAEQQEEEDKSFTEVWDQVVEGEEEVAEEKSFTEASDIDASDVLSSSGESFHEALEALRQIVMSKEGKTQKDEESTTASKGDYEEEMAQQEVPSYEDYDGDEEATQVTSNSQSSSQRSLIGEGLPTEEVTVEEAPLDDTQDWQIQHHPPHWNTPSDMNSLD